MYWIVQVMLWLLFLIPAHHRALAQHCGCRDQLNFAIQKIESNYAGFRDKVTTRTAATYEAHTAHYRKIAGAEKNADSCFRLIKEWLLFFQDGHLQVRKPASNASFKTNSGIIDQFLFKQVDDSTNLIRIPSFNHIYKNIIDSLITVHYAKITHMPYLLIDVRGNGGGSDISYAELVSFFYTNPIITIGSEKLSTPDNIAKYQVIANDKNYPEGTRDYAKRVISEMQKIPGRFFSEGDDTLIKSARLPNPTLVGILVDKKCASTTEQFLLAARQSKKTVLFGEHSAGILDYANMHFLDFPCQKWQLGYATSRSRRLPDAPVDNVGISPDVNLTSAHADWVKFSAGYMRQMPVFALNGTPYTDTAEVDLHYLAKQIAGNSKGTFNTVRNIVWWTNKNFTWNFTDYKKRTVKQIVCQMGGNCNEQALVVRALLRELNIKTRRTSEINIQPESARRQQNAEQRVAEIGNRGSVFGFRHNDHVWIEFFDEEEKQWIPADPTLGLIGLEKWLKARIGFEPRVNHAVIASADMLVPVSVFALQPDGKIAEDRSSYYLLESFNNIYGKQLQQLPSWPQWETLVKFIQEKSRAAFEGNENLHLYTEKIRELKEVYERLRSEYQLRKS